MKALLGPLLKKNYSAVVLNARDGSEVALMVEAGMRVVGECSEHHDKFPGGVVPDTKQEIADAVRKNEAESQAPVVARDVAVESRVEGGKLGSGGGLLTEDDLEKEMKDADEETELKKGLKGFENEAEEHGFMESQEVGSGVGLLTGKFAEWGVNLELDNPALGSSNPATEVPKGGAIAGNLRDAVAEAADLQKRGENIGVGLGEKETPSMPREGDKDEEDAGDQEKETSFKGQEEERVEDGKGIVAGEEVADIAS
jgi:hypothetical protein